MNLADRVARNFGCPQPEGYRKSLRLMREEMANHFDMDAFKRLVLILSDAKMV